MNSITTDINCEIDIHTIKLDHLALDPNELVLGHLKQEQWQNQHRRPPRQARPQPARIPRERIPSEVHDQQLPTPDPLTTDPQETANLHGANPPPTSIPFTSTRSNRPLRPQNPGRIPLPRRPLRAPMEELQVEVRRGELE